VIALHIFITICAWLLTAPVTSLAIAVTIAAAISASISVASVVALGLVEIFSIFALGSVLLGRCSLRSRIQKSFNVET